MTPAVKPVQLAASASISALDGKAEQILRADQELTDSTPTDSDTKGVMPASVINESAQLQKLRSENERLKEMVAKLEDETLGLNIELLQLELDLTETDGRTEPIQVVETKTICNFVNVPLGGEVVQESYDPHSQPQDFIYVDKQIANDTYYDGSQGYSTRGYDNPLFAVDAPSPETGWSRAGQIMPSNHQLYWDGSAYLPFVPDP